MGSEARLRAARRYHHRQVVATSFMPSARARLPQLERLLGIEDRVWLQVQDCERIYPIADEDLDRSRADKTSSVHFLRYELAPTMIAAVQRGATISAGIDHPAYTVGGVPLDGPTRDSLAADLAPASIN